MVSHFFADGQDSEIVINYMGGSRLVPSKLFNEIYKPISMKYHEESEYVTGDQSFSYRKRRGRFRYPKWNIVHEWRSRWDREKVENVLELLGQEGSVEKICEKTGFKSIEITDVHGNKKSLPDLRGLDVVLVPKEHRKIGGDKRNATQDRTRLAINAIFR